MFASNNLGLHAGASPSKMDGIEPVRTPLVAADLRVTGGMRPATQVPVERSPKQTAYGVFARVRQAFAGLVDNTGNPKEAVRSLVQPSREERRGPQHGPLSGSAYVYDRDADPTYRGVNIETVEMGNLGGDLDITQAQDHGPQDVDPSSFTNREANQEGPFAEPFDALRTHHGNFPFVAVDQLPNDTRNCVLAQVNPSGQQGGAFYQGEIALPADTVAVRITWSGGVDLWWSMQGMAYIPTVANGANQSLYDGLSLNPDTTKKYLAKNKRAISFASPNPTVVSVTCYTQAAISKPGDRGFNGWLD